MGGQPGTVSTVTLLTGDQVQVQAFSGGKEAVTVKPGPGRERVSFAYWSHGDSVTVVPSDAMDMLQRGLLDARLFDVKSLARMGYDDRHRSDLPLIVRHGKGDAGKAARSALARSAQVRGALASVNATVVSERKADAAKVWNAMTRSSARGRDLAPGLSGIWLDGKVKASLDRSVPQIGAPAAWDAGFTGKGVTTAVLDTGIDAGHPDLADAVVESKDFTGSPNGVKDGNGHGTHVASIITGSGSAVGGKYKGVAPDTRLLVGKVMDDKGGGSESQIIVGMEWAAARGARVISMSLGGRSTDGTDPMSQAVNSLTASSGALFVVAAGNSGAAEDVSTPAVADAALAVGAVDADDQLANFSSRGPRIGDKAVKPEITAPGVGIVAARAAGTELGEVVDEHYVRLNGTSMATPHVAGAAAILAQQHPDWTAAQLKAALTSTAKPTAGLGVFEQGTGRVDVAKAVQQKAYASPSAVSSYLKWPHTEPVTKTVTYHNDTSAELTLDLSVDVSSGSAKSGLVKPQTSTVTVPAHGTADVGLVIDPAAAAPGTYSGFLTARSSDGQTVIRTAVGVFVEDEVYDAKIRITDRAGKRMPTSSVGVLNLDTGQAFPARVSGGELTARVPKGRYSIDALIYGYSGDAVNNVTLASAPDVHLTADTSVTLDARNGKPVAAKVDSSTASPAIRWTGINQNVAGTLFELRDFTMNPDVGLYAVPTPKVTSRPYTFTHLATLEEPATAAPAARAYNLALTRDGHIPNNPVFEVHDDDLAKVNSQYHAQGTESSGSRSNLAAIDGSDRASGGYYNISLPSKRTEYFTPGSRISWLSLLDTGTSFETTSLKTHTAGTSTTQHWNKAAINPAAQASRCGNMLLAPVFAFSPSTPGHLAFAYDYTGQTTLLRDGTEIGSSDDPVNTFFEGLPDEPGKYTLRLAAMHQNPSVALATKVDAEWTFTSAKPEDSCQAMSMLNLRIDANFDLNNRAPGDEPLPLTVNVERADGSTPEVKTITLEATFDDGDTWQPLTLTGKGAAFTTTVPAASTGAQYVGLRASVSDQDGNHLKQTVLRTYRLQ
jgi:subtilisin family serine protease